ncbi:MAG TPA: DUF192 domain-containing protein [Bryobacteraceae bacterium]|nr:DUF192 domain-containing protein [Bryobacteraceae bacterium]
MRYILPLALLVVGVSCRSKPQPVDDFSMLEVTLPHGQVIKTETMISTADLERGMMFRTSLAPDHGMLFVHAAPGYYPYWMYRTLIPLDVIWMDNDHRILQMLLDAQPCKTTARECPQYVCPKPFRYVLELNGGMARKSGLEVGQKVQW